MQETTPRLMLRNIRHRAGVSSTTLGQALGFAGGNGYLRYEKDTRFDERRIPYRIISKIAPHLVGRGSPPVTNEELLAISEVGSLSEILEQQTAYSSPPTDARKHEARPERYERYEPPRASWDGRLPVRYRIERGVLIPQSKLSTLEYGHAPVVYSRRWDAVDQFATYVVDGTHHVSAGSYLHCVVRQALDSDGSRPGIAVVAVPTDNHVEIVAAKTSDAENMRGTILGYAIAEYRQL